MKAISMITDRDLWEESVWKDILTDIAAERGMRRIISPVLESRFGPLDDDLVCAIERADKDQLESFAPHLLTSTLEQFRERLGLPPAP